MEVDQRASRVALVDGGIGLHEIRQGSAARADDGAPESAHDADGDGRRALQAEGVAHGDDPVAHLERPGSRERQGRQVCGVNLQHRDVARLVPADDLSVERASVEERYRDAAGIADDVAVRHDVAI